jgi:hypothetical protein
VVPSKEEIDFLHSFHFKGRIRITKLLNADVFWKKEENGVLDKSDELLLSSVSLAKTLDSVASFFQFIFRRTNYKTDIILALENLSWQYKNCFFI